MKKKRLRHHFLLLEVVASLGLFAFFATGILTPYATARAHLVRFEKELELKRYSQLAAMELHLPGALETYIPNWDSSEPKSLSKASWNYKLSREAQKALGSDHLVLQMSCVLQTPLRPDLKKNQPVWRRLIEAKWLSEQAIEGWQQTFTIVSGPSEAKGLKNRLEGPHQQGGP